MSSSAGSWLTGEIRLTAEETARLGGMVGTDLGERYEVGEYLGRGAFAAVWRARDRSTGQDVAVKRFHAVGDRPREFYRELSVLLRLAHPGVVQVVNLLECPSGTRYLILDYCPGGTLRTALSRARRAGRRPAPLEVARLALRLGEALLAAHEQGIVHRDIKPENILFVSTPVPGRTLPPVRIADFGLARLLAGKTPTGALQGVSGSPAYMAPEMFWSQAVPASDWYSLGVVLFEAATGELPFLGTAEQLARSHMNEAPAMQAVPEKLTDLIGPLLAKDPGQRPQPQSWLDLVRTRFPELNMPPLNRESDALILREIQRLGPTLDSLTALLTGDKTSITDTELLAAYGFNATTTHPSLGAAMAWENDEEQAQAEDEQEPEAGPFAEPTEKDDGGRSVEAVLGHFDWS